MATDFEMIQKVLITGASGAVGPLVVEAFSSQDYFIRTLSIDPFPDEIRPRDVEVRIGDVTDISAVEMAMEDVDTVVHMAALLHIIDPPADLKEQYERINIGGTSNVMDAAIRAGVRRVVFFSTIAVYGSTGGKVVSEDTDPSPDTDYARTKLEAEKVVLRAQSASGEKIGTVLRLGAVYGGRVKGNYQRLVTSLAKGNFVLIGDCANRRTLIHEKDVASAATLAAMHRDAGGKVFNVTDSKFHTMAGIIRAICDALGRKPPSFRLPSTPARFLAVLMEDGARLFGRKSPINRATIDKFTEDIAVDGSRFRDLLGFNPIYNLKTGWKEAVKEMRRTGVI